MTGLLHCPTNEGGVKYCTRTCASTLYPVLSIRCTVLFCYLLAIEVGISSERASGAGEGEHGKGDGDRHVHADLYTHIKSVRVITTS